MSFKFSFENTNAVIPEPWILIQIATSVVEAAVVNPNGTKTHLANYARTFFINGKPTDINRLKENIRNFQKLK